MSSMPDRPRPSRRGLTGALALAAAAVLALGGCTASGVSSDAGAEGSDGPVSLTVARGQVNIENSLIADEQGFFEDEGLDVALEVSQGAAATNSAVISGEFDIALTDAIAATRAISEGMPIVVVSGQKYADPEHPLESGVLLPPGSPVTDWADLEGKKVGIPDLGGLPQLTVLRAMEENGLDADSVEFVALPLPALAEAAAKGEVDAIFVFSVFYFTATANGFTPLGTGVSEFLPDSPQSVWIASRQFAEENPETIERFRAALDAANAFGVENEDAVRAVYHENTEMPAEFIDNVMVLAPLSTELPQDGWELLIDVMVDNGELPEALEYDEIVWEGAR
ncbi:ABC transporter substrate-binding protein [Leucobacter allii]|uniref:ABC transporter substrate-binding protein n=1 Tax=Leucobacter allii TaxID=2932247 RepID=UPI001FD0D131|nr:ABC transporter substrate-binding protein [Leucobacter allii]UOR01871.1 ABC transporter substrate-binding protein [Leucobacter allii]